MTLADGQVQVRSLVMGADTIYRFPEHFNPYSRTVRADQGGQRAWNHGSWSGAEWTEEVVIPMRMYVMTTDPASYVAAQQDLAAAFAPSNTDLELRWAVAGTEYLMYGRPRMVNPEARRLDGGSYVSAAFVALDPRVYSGSTHSQQLMLPVTTGGLTFPVTFPITFPATVISGRATITNAGKAPTGLQLRIDGPVTEPRVSLLAGGVTSTLRLWLTLTSGQWLDIDTMARTVYINGTASRRGNASGDWPTLPSGMAELAFDASVYNPSAQLTATWRDSWY